MFSLLRLRTRDMQCTVHGTEFKVVPAGVSKVSGKPYQSFMACSERGCREKPPRAETPVAKFEQSLDMSAGVTAAANKDRLITKTAVVKSLIERGDKYSLEVLQEAEAWVRWIEGKTMPVVPKDTTWNAIPKAVNSNGDEISLDSIPF